MQVLLITLRKSLDPGALLFGLRHLIAARVGEHLTRSLRCETTEHQHASRDQGRTTQAHPAMDRDMLALFEIGPKFFKQRKGLRRPERNVVIRNGIRTIDYPMALANLCLVL